MGASSNGSSKTVGHAIVTDVSHRRHVGLGTGSGVSRSGIRHLLCAVLTTLGPPAFAAPARVDDAKHAPEPAWYDRIKIRGYTQVRYNRLGATNPDLKNEQADKSIGAPGGFLIRRARVILYGDMSRHVSIYLQPDFAAGSVGDVVHLVQLRDWYSDIHLDRRREFRFRVGQSKVPYGFENMQSSQNRLPLDRHDALNSTVKDERDLGVFFYWAPESVRKKLKELVDSGLKGSGDYGMTAIGFYNGQTANQRERNDNKHFVARVAYPFDVGGQTLELAAGGYTGRYVPSVGEGIRAAKEHRDFRLHGTFVLYPKPFGVQAEYTAGYGPERVGDRVEERPLEGGYVMAMWRQKLGDHVLVPYVRVHRYDGGKKWIENAPRHVVRELNAGLEWQATKWLELTTELMASERTVDGETEAGRLVRFQLQVNY